MSKSPEAACALLEEMTSNSYHWASERTLPKKSARMYEIDKVDMLNAKMDSLVRMFGKVGSANVVSNPILICENCEGVHMSIKCMQVENAQFVANFNRLYQNKPYSNTYNTGWRNHPNFSGSN